MSAPHFEEGTHHCAIFHADDVDGPQRTFKECELHPGHKDFMTVEEAEKRLPVELGLGVQDPPTSKKRADKNKRSSHKESCHCDGHGSSHSGSKNTTSPPGHQEFMSVDQFLHKGPSEFNLSIEDLPMVKNQIDRTVRVVVTHVSAARPASFMKLEKRHECTEKKGCHNWIRFGTGYLQASYDFNNAKKPCPCLDCEASQGQTSNRKSYYFIMKTSAYVIFDEKEAQNSVFEFFYDSEDRSLVEKVYGVGILNYDNLSKKSRKRSVICVTHDCGLAEKLHLLCEPIDEPLGRVMVLQSHPMGDILCGMDPFSLLSLSRMTHLSNLI